MSLAWPAALGVLLAIPALLLIAWLVRRRRARGAVAVSSAQIVRAALPGRSAWHRRIPAGLLIAALGVLGIAAARPQATVTLSSNNTTLLLALDVSASMCATDVPPNRLAAAQDAATAFIKDQPADRVIGLVAFAGTAGLLVPPTTDKKILLDAIAGLSTSRGTAIGQAILTALDAIADIDPAVPPTGVDVPANSARPKVGDAIVVLTDGANTRGVDPQTAAEQAAARGVPVYTIGFGTTNPTSLVCTPEQVGSGGGFRGGGGFGGGGFGGGGFGGGGGGGRFSDRNPLLIDEGALQSVADTTGGQYFRAESAGALGDALAKLPSTLTTVHKKTDLAAWFAGGAALLTVVGVGLSLWWNRPRGAARAGRPAQQPV
jgi:Ca-activated chloride channel family protein